MTQRISTLDISTASGTQMRAAIDVDTVDDYATCLDSLPPIVVFYDGSRYYCADGFHRIEAHRLSGRTDIACDVRSGTLRDAILFAAGANASHGKRRSNLDKRRAIETLLRDEEWRQKSDRWIADVVKVGAPLVGAVRSELFPPVQLKEITVDKPSEFRRVQSQDGKLRTVPQRPAKQSDPADHEQMTTLFRKAVDTNAGAVVKKQSSRPIQTTAEVVRVTPVESQPPRTHEEYVTEAQKGAMALFSRGESPVNEPRSILARMREVKEIAKAIQRDIAAAGGEISEDAASSWDFVVTHAINSVREAGGGDE